MFKYVLKRVLIGAVTLFLLASATFFIMKATPGSPISSESIKTEAAREAVMAKYHLDKPVFQQYMIYIGNVAQGDLGESMTSTTKGRPATELIFKAFPVTARLGTVAFLLALVGGIGLGVAAALSKRKWVNNVCMFIATIGVSVPSFLLALLMIMFFGVFLRVLPFTNLYTPAHYVMPAIALALYPIATIARLTRSSMLEVMKQDYIVLARSKGTPYRKVVMKHAIKNAMLPVITYAGPMFAFLLTGSFVIESVFAIPGIGQVMVSSITNRDYMMIMAITIFLGALVICFNILSDIIAAALDPRIKLK